MVCETSWYQADSVIYTMIAGNVTMADIEANDAVIHDMIVNSESQIHIIIDIRELGQFPTRIPEIKQSSERYLRHPNTGIVLVVGKANPVTTFLSRVISQITGIQLVQLATVEEAITYLQERDHLVQ